MSDLCERYTHIMARIEQAARASGRPAGAVRLVAVSKTHGVEAVERLAACGQRHFGESRVQEGVPKIAAVAGAALEWHFLGPVQRNKARLIARHFHWLHSLEGLDAAEALSRHAHAAGTRLHVLIEVNVTADARKHGLAAAALPAFLEAYCAREWPGLVLSGLMTMAAHGASEGAARATFARLRGLAADCRQGFGLTGFDELSMGMSDDYPWAIAEGATMVRVGRALFGARDAG
ncbi:YggS family pyridoxal phosphate-dependent enzyme [Acidiferrobacter sp.]|jgi:pyridoxal phosphate enzyme (YggS family)|uniref:YggS family pyridoxal phosphate-dependent enzyme n=1 Tax=Acidiferrobacter sp. TaxID=1872107 RepID=UPI0026382751|nr:YggS family pyridoxal phosphate-dependent enzyme [Acidiferrobacter sp.]